MYSPWPRPFRPWPPFSASPARYGFLRAHARYPDIQLDIGVSDREVDLIEDNVDCVTGAAPRPNLRWWRGTSAS